MRQWLLNVPVLVVSLGWLVPLAGAAMCHFWDAELTARGERDHHSFPFEA